MDSTKGFTITFGELLDIVTAIDAEDQLDTDGIIEATEVKLIAIGTDCGAPDPFRTFLARDEKHLYGQLQAEDCNEDDGFFVFPVTGEVLVISSGVDKITKIGELKALQNV